MPHKALVSKLPIALLGLASVTLPSAVLADALDSDVAGELNLELLPPFFTGPTDLAFLPDGRLLVAQQGGQIVLWEGGEDIRTLGTIDTQAGGERGLLGLAVDPMFASSRRLYVYFSDNGAQEVGYVTLDGATDEFNGANVEVLLTGLSASANHVGGALAFGPDGHLYMGVGDTGCNCSCSPNDTPTNYFATCLNKLHGKILRIDREGGIPADNPLVGVENVAACAVADNCGAAGTEPEGTAAPRTEIYSWGFRNPFRFAFDEPTGYLWIGDVGEITFEEITVSTSSAQHHGWPWREGAAGDPVTECAARTPESGNCTEPALTYSHDEPPGAGQASITGGAFTHHCSWPAAWNGVYIFGDYVKNAIWAATPNAARDGVEVGRTRIVTEANSPVDFALGPDGAMYYVNINNGTLWRINPANPAPCPDMDAGPIPDTGTSTDAGVIVPDAGPSTDAGTLADAGGADAGVMSDAGTEATDASRPLDNIESVGGGCGGCRSTGTPAGANLALIALCLIWLARRRSAPPPRRSMRNGARGVPKRTR